MVALGIYIAGTFAMWLWDSFIGLGFEFDGHQRPPLFLVCVFWFIATPILLLIKLAGILGKVKNSRIAREENQKRIRIAAQKELDTYLEEVEAELHSIVRRAK